MIAIAQIIIIALLTLQYAITNVDFTSWLSILGFIGFFIGINILFTISVILLFIIIVYLTKPFGSNCIWKHDLLMMFSNYLFFSVLRVNVEVKGLENLPNHHRFVVYSNHIEYNDPFYMKAYYKHQPLGFIAKKPLFRYPILKSLLESIGCIPIGRMADRSSLQTILKAIEMVKNGQPMAIFPEGQRSYSNQMNDFKPGAFKVATKAKADISLMALYNFHEINKFRLKKVKVYMTILPLIKYEDIKDMDTVSISQMAYKLIDQELDEYKKRFND